MNKAIYFVLPAILILGIYTIQSSYELAGFFKPYSFSASNDILTLSIDKSSYKIYQTIQILGNVNHYSGGTKVAITLTDPHKLFASSFNGMLDRYGTFTTSFNIPQTFSSGNYTMTAYYDGDTHKTQVSLPINISDGSAVSHIFIPLGASSQANKFNFNPRTVDVKQGTKLFFKNNDVTFHSVKRGSVYADGTLYLDNYFETSYVAPGAELVLYLSPGNYNYFCQVHPWLWGTITVEKDPSQTAKATTNVTSGNLDNFTKLGVTTGLSQDARLSASSPPGKVPSYLDETLVAIWKERNDLQKSYPEAAKGNLTKLQHWAATYGWNEDKRLAVLIPPGKVPSYLDQTLVAIWKERNDLQSWFPKVAKGNLTGMKKWASTTGWNEDKRLAVLIPPGKVPSYLDQTLVAIWKERNDLQSWFPKVAKGNLTGMKKWASTTGWNEDKRLAVLIPPGKVPSYLDQTLVAIWKERNDLQSWFPKVAKGNLTGMKKWASTTGWNEDKRLAVLIPPGKVPSYLDQTLVAIWKERNDLQSWFPKVAKGNLT